MITVTDHDIRGSRHIGETVPESAALAGFRFHFENEGHKIKEITALRNDSNVHVNFQDNDGNDPYTFVLKYHDLEAAGAVVEKREFSGKGSTDIADLPAIPDQYVAAIQVFSFKKEQTDVEIHKVGVKRNQIIFSTDKDQIDFRRTWSFDYVVQFVLIDREFFSDSGILEYNSHSSPDTLPSLENSDRSAVITEFEFTYVKGGNADERDSHYLRTCEIDLTKRASSSWHTRDHGSWIEFNDGDLDDKVDVYLTYEVFE